MNKKSFEERQVDALESIAESLAVLANPITVDANGYDPSAFPVPKVTWGHGHVYPRIDGSVTRCGGPSICSQCSIDQQRLNKNRRDGI